MKSTFRKTTSGRRSGQRFDAQNGVVTEALVFLGELDPDAIGAAMEDATHYEPTPLAQFEELVQLLPADLANFTFLDIGAGLGRVLMLAAEKPFRQIIGIECSGALCETARDNLVRWRQRHQEILCKDVRIVCADALQAKLPPGDLVVYLFNPFGENSTAALAHRLARESRGRLYVLYHTPVHREVFDDHGGFTLEHDSGFALVYRKT